MTPEPIDVWDADTFDHALVSELGEATASISGYLETDRLNLLEREATGHRLPYASNRYASEYYGLLDSLAALMDQRSIRAWHYTRLTADEAQAFVRNGPILSDLSGIRRRIDAQVADGLITSAVADRLWKGSPFQEQEDIRSGRFWAVSQPVPIDDSGVELLLGHWGGESVYFWQEDSAIVSLLRSMGAPHIFELKIPLRTTDRAFYAARSVVATFARSLGCQAADRGFDVCVTQPLGPQAVIAVHSGRDETFRDMGRGYPVRFGDQ